MTISFGFATRGYMTPYTWPPWMDNESRMLFLPIICNKSFTVELLLTSSKYSPSDLPKILKPAAENDCMFFAM